MSFTKKDKQILPDTKCLLTHKTIFIFEIEMILDDKKKKKNERIDN